MERTRTVLAAFANAEEREHISCLCEPCGLRVAGFTDSAAGVLSALSAMETDFVFISVLLPGLPAAGMHEDLLTRSAYKRPRILYFVPACASALMKNAYSPMIEMPADEHALKEALRTISELAAGEEDRRKAEEILALMGFAPVPARQHLAYACAICASDAMLARKLTSVIYPDVAKAFGISVSRAADGMRRLVDKAFLHGNIDYQYELFQNTIDETRGKPTLSQLIALVGERVRRGYEK